MSVKFYTARTQTGETRRIGMISPGPAAYVGSNVNKADQYSNYYIPGAYFTSAADAQAVYPETVDPEATYFAMTTEEAEIIKNWGFKDVIPLENYSENTPLRLFFGDYSYIDCWFNDNSNYIYFRYTCSIGFITTYRRVSNASIAAALNAPGYSQYQRPDSGALYYYNAAPIVVKYSQSQFAIGCSSFVSIVDILHYWTPDIIFISGSTFYNADGSRTSGNNIQTAYSQSRVDAGTDHIGYFFRTFWNGIGFSVRHSVQIHNETPSFGTVSASPSAALPGDTVLLTLIPSEHAMLADFSVSSGGAAIPCTELADGAYSFTMPNGDVSVSATFQRIPLQAIADHGSFLKGFAVGQALRVNPRGVSGDTTIPARSDSGAQYDRDSFLLGLTFGRTFAGKIL